MANAGEAPDTATALRHAFVTSRGRPGVAAGPDVVVPVSEDIRCGIGVL